MYRYHAYCLNFSSEIELPECNGATAAADDFVILRKKLICPQLEVTTIHRRGITAETAIGADGALWLFWEGVATFRASAGRLLEVDVIAGDPDLLSLFTVSEAIGMILFQRKYYLLHASAIRVGDTGWVFMGAPGAGKSTTSAAFVKAGCPLLSDDLTAICFDGNGQPFILPAYPQLKIWENTVAGLGYRKEELTPVSEGINKFALLPRENFSAAPVQLGRLYFLHRDDTLPDVKQMSPMELPVETLKHFPMPNQFLTPEVLQQHFRQSMMCATNAKAFAQRRPDGFGALEEWVRDKISH